MTALLWLIPAALFLGALGLAAFFWSVRSGQYEDLDGAAERILLNDEGPIVDEEDEAGKKRGG
ncbi:cbb3-type cytochrome oxidase assembly protein CcoS [Marinicauda salina]|jgi:cbb3-type cytochrome oxidase maturation protein|uniref:Cbb3-type cytochrome oxidase assembly protein CcoS n=1 Tax=Marinicauda salina TaxID=2135793 RepID=A0A2U2BWT5_9PROT|nr:cbb3-type cytochrome oxidase assembly protein CcoS [Marinicauda salina]PWE18481.1 cbb3-type cytochrome oxidase assembly protein CcoS [Marinicauda salina]